MICGTYSPFADALKISLEDAGASVTVFCGNAASIARVCSQKRYDIVLILAIGDHRRYMDIVRCIKKNCPGAISVVAATSITYSEKRRYYSAGITSCLNMPMTLSEMIEFFSDEIEFSGRIDKYSHIYEFLHLLGFRKNLSGFDCLICAATLALDDPETLGDMTGKVYPEISARLGISPSQAERSLRYAAETLDAKCELCRILRIASGDELNNHELISAVADAYVVYMKGKALI